MSLIHSRKINLPSHPQLSRSFSFFSISFPVILSQFSIFSKYSAHLSLTLFLSHIVVSFLSLTGRSPFWLSPLNLLAWQHKILQVCHLPASLICSAILSMASTSQLLNSYLNAFSTFSYIPRILIWFITQIFMCKSLLFSIKQKAFSLIFLATFLIFSPKTPYLTSLTTFLKLFHYGFSISHEYK